MPTFNKLVRDKIPEIIEKDGKTCRTKVLEQREYITELQKKVKEEFEEYLTTTSNEDALLELADMLEIIYALSESHGYDPLQLEEARRKKAQEKGGFKEKYLLIDVDDYEIQR